MDDAFENDIKFNCDVSDAQYWGYFSVCGLLLRYRDLYRSETGEKPWSDIPRRDIAEWIAAKESRWPELEQKTFRPLVIDGVAYDPFDVVAVNRVLSPRNLIYGAGYGMYLKPTFFLAELRSIRQVGGLTVYTSGTERVRDLFTSPAMLQDKTVFLRIEPLTILLLYKHSELNALKSSFLESAFARFGFKHRQIIDRAFEERLERMALTYAEVLLAHELAEATEERDEWKDILALSAGDRKLEHYLRAVKDLVADTSPQGPYRMMIDSRDMGALGLSIALTEGYRRVLFPEILDAFAELSRTGDWGGIEKSREKAYERFRSWRDGIVEKYRTLGSGDRFIRSVKDAIPASAAKK
jgi:hypothetical protein